MRSPSYELSWYTSAFMCQAGSELDIGVKPLYSALLMAVARMETTWNQ